MAPREAADPTEVTTEVTPQPGETPASPLPQWREAAAALVPWGLMYLPFSRCGCGHASALWLEIKPPLALIYLLLQPLLDENQTSDFALGNWSSARSPVEAGKRLQSPPTPRHSTAEPFSLEGVTLPLAGSTDLFAGPSLHLLCTRWRSCVPLFCHQWRGRELCLPHLTGNSLRARAGPLPSD